MNPPRSKWGNVWRSMLKQRGMEGGNRKRAAGPRSSMPSLMGIKDFWYPSVSFVYQRKVQRGFSISDRHKKEERASANKRAVGGQRAPHDNANATIEGEHSGKEQTFPDNARP